MRTKNGYALYIILALLVLGVIYTACKDITPTTEQISENIELKLNK